MQIYTIGAVLEPYLKETKEDGSKTYGWRVVEFRDACFDDKGKEIFPKETSVSKEGLLK